MLAHRVIPCLLIHNRGLVKTTRFSNPEYVGDPINAIKIFSEKEVDELLVIDISASEKKTEPNYKLIEAFASECFIPLTYGGGIKDLEQAKTLFSIGIEKLSIQTAALEDTKIISKISNKFGAQSVVGSVDVKKDWLGNYKLFNRNLQTLKSLDWKETIQTFVEAGAGEILLNSVDKDGTMNGPDLKLISKACQDIDVPVVALGGVSSLEDIRNCVRAGADAVAAGSYFVFQGPHRAVLISYPNYNELELLFQRNESDINE